MIRYYDTQAGFKLVSVAEDDLKLLVLLLLTTKGWDYRNTPPHRFTWCLDPAGSFLPVGALNK